MHQVNYSQHNSAKAGMALDWNFIYDEDRRYYFLSFLSLFKEYNIKLPIVVIDNTAPKSGILSPKSKLITAPNMPMPRDKKIAIILIISSPPSTPILYLKDIPQRLF